MSLDFIVLNLAHRHTLLFLGRTGHALHKSSSHSIEADVPNYCSTASGSHALQNFVNDFTFPHPPLLSSPSVSYRLHCRSAARPTMAACRLRCVVRTPLSCSHKHEGYCHGAAKCSEPSLLDCVPRFFALRELSAKIFKGKQRRSVSLHLHHEKSLVSSSKPSSPAVGKSCFTLSASQNNDLAIEEVHVGMENDIARWTDGQIIQTGELHNYACAMIPLTPRALCL